MLRILPAAVLVLLLLPACRGNAPALAPTVPANHTITYRIDSETPRAAIDLTYTNETGATVQEENFTPWQMTFEAEPGEFVYVSAQLTGRIARTVSCSLAVDGVVIEQAESKGQYVIATCKGSAK